MRLLILFLFLPTLLFSAPHPTTGLSKINSMTDGYIFSTFGFKLNGQIALPWQLDKTDSNLDEFNLSYGTGRLNLKSDAASSKLVLDSYVKRFLKDYNLYGFTVTKVTKLEIADGHSMPQIILEISQKNKSTKSMQYFILNKQKILTATCSDDPDTFDRTAKLCQRFIDEIEWL